jgi:hypothetical protein
VFSVIEEIIHAVNFVAGDRRYRGILLTGKGGGGPLERVGTHVHKITNIPVFLYGAFDGRNSITRALGMNLPPLK